METIYQKYIVVFESITLMGKMKCTKMNKIFVTVSFIPDLHRSHFVYSLKTKLLRFLELICPAALSMHVFVPHITPRAQIVYNIGNGNIDTYTRGY